MAFQIDDRTEKIDTLSNSGHGEKQEMRSRQQFAAQIFIFFGSIINTVDNKYQPYLNL